MNYFDFKTVNSAALSALPAIVARLLPNGKVISGEWVCRNPKRSDRTAGSFKVNLRHGKWADFATGDSGGDLISLVAYLENINQVKAARLLSKMLGLGGAE